MHVTRKDKNIAAIADAVGYRGRKIEIFPTTEVDVRSANYWDGGTRTTYTFLKLPSLEALNVPSMHPAYDQRVTRPLPLRPGMRHYLRPTHDILWKGRGNYHLRSSR